jgi:hypothetical protein
MRSALRSIASVSCFALGATVASSALAQADVDRAAARQLGEDGQKALTALDFKTAEADFARADKLVHAPTLLLGLARALAGQGKLLEAQEAYKRIVREGVAPGSPAVFQKAVDDATKEVADVSPKIGAVTITVKTAGGEAQPSSLQITWDGAPVNAATLGIRRPSNPGSHSLHAEADGYKSVDLKINVPVGGAADAPLTLGKDPNAPAPATVPAATPATMPGASAPPSTAPAPDQATATGGGPGIWPWVALGVGGAGLIAGGVTGFMAMSKHSDLVSACNNGPCPPSKQSDVDSYNTLGLVSTVGFIVGGVGAAAGVALLVLQPNLVSSSPPAPTTGSGVRVVPVVGLGTVGAVVTF